MIVNRNAHEWEEGFRGPFDERTFEAVIEKCRVHISNKVEQEYQNCVQMNVSYNSWEIDNVKEEIRTEIIDRLWESLALEEY